VGRKVTGYELSSEADRDVSDIFDYTELEFGVEQAVNYLKQLERCFNALVDNPESGRRRQEIRRGLYSTVSGSHVVFYRIRRDVIRVIRVLHGSRDLPRYFED